MLKTTRSSIVLVFKVDDNEVIDSGGSAGTNNKSVSGLDISRKTTMSKSQTKSGYSEESKFLTSGARKAFNRLR